MSATRRSATARAIGSLLIAALLALTGCNEEVSTGAMVAPDPSAPVSVHVVNYPLLYLAERIGGPLARVALPAPPDVDPAEWTPEPDIVAEYQAADLILLNGAGYARWVALASLPRRHVVDTAEGFRAGLIERTGMATHAHGSSGSHAHEGFEDHVWLDPTLAILQARAVATALTRVRPGAAKSFERALAGLEVDLEDLDAQLAKAADHIADRPLLFSHPVYGYLIRRYGLNARSLHWEPDEVPDDLEWRALRELLAEHPARWMLWEAEPLSDTRAALLALGVESAVYAPGGNAPDQGDFLSFMRRNAAVLESIAARTPSP